MCDKSISLNAHSFDDFHVDVACNTNASDVCEIKFTYLLNLISANLTESKCGVIAFMVGYCTVAESVVLN